MNQEELRRLVNKSDRQLFIYDLITGFELSKVEADALYDRITRFNRVTTMVSEDRVRKRKQLSLWEKPRASLYRIAEWKGGIGNCGCVTCCVAGIREYNQKETK